VEIKICVLRKILVPLDLGELCALARGLPGVLIYGRTANIG
jgi:hypothetical protein